MAEMKANHESGEKNNEVEFKKKSIRTALMQKS